MTKEIEEMSKKELKGFWNQVCAKTKKDLLEWIDWIDTQLEEKGDWDMFDTWLEVKAKLRKFIKGAK